jgi:hypothetical protein
MAPKSISIPPNPSTRVGLRRAAARKLAAEAEPGVPELVPPVPPRRPPGRTAQSAPTHRYHVGERLRMGGGGYSVARIAAVCKVVALLPYEGRGSLFYRVRSETEAFERVVSEADLSRG